MFRSVPIGCLAAGFAVFSASATPVMPDVDSPVTVASAKQLRISGRADVPSFTPSLAAGLRSLGASPAVQAADEQRLELRPFNLYCPSPLPGVASKLLLFFGFLLVLFRWLQPAYRPRNYGR